MIPWLEEAMGNPGFLLANAEQHHAFLPSLEKLEQHARETKPGEYNGEELCKMIDGFAGELHQHLKDEIDTLLAMQPYDSSKLLNVWRRCEEEAQKQDMVCALSFAFVDRPSLCSAS